MAKPELPALRQPSPSFCMMPRPNARAIRRLAQDLDAYFVQTDRSELKDQTSLRDSST